MDHLSVAAPHPSDENKEIFQKLLVLFLHTLPIAEIHVNSHKQRGEISLQFWI